MENEASIYVAFHNKAGQLYTSLLNRFEDHCLTFNRRNDEYRFRELKEKYINSLKQELQHEASLLLQKYSYGSQLRETDQQLNYYIKDYLHRFVQKVNNL